MAGKGAALAMILSARDDGVSGVLGGIEKQVSGFGESLKGAFAAVGAIGIVDGIVSGLTSIVGGAVEAADATGRLQAQLGLTADQAAELGAVAQDVFRGGFGESAGEVNAALATVRQNLGDIGAEGTKNATEAALTLKDLFGAAETESTRTVSVMMKNFDGLSQTQAFDLITAGFQQGGDYSGELLDTLREYSPQFAKMGMSAEQMTGVLIAGAQAGAFNLDKVGDAVKEFAIRSIDGSKATREGFAAIGMDADQMAANIAKGGKSSEQAFQATIAGLAAMEDPVKRNAAGVALFGTQWEDIGPKVVESMAAGMKGVEGFEGATDRAATASFGLAGQWESLKRTVMGFLVDAITPLMPAFTTFVSGAIGGITSLMGPIKEIGVALGQLFSGGMDGMMDGIATLMKFMSGDQAMNLGKAVYGLGEAFRAVFEGDIDGAIGSALLALKDFGSFIVTAVESWAASFAAWVDGADTGMTGQLGEMLTGLMGWLQTAGAAIIERLAIWAGAFVDWVAPKIPPLLAELGSLLAELLGWLLGTGLPNLISKLAEWGLALVEWVAPRIPPLLAALGGLLLALGGWLIGTALPAIVSKLVEWGTAFVEWVGPKIPPLLVALGELLAQLGGWIVGTALPAIGEKLAEWAGAFVDWVADSAAKLPGELELLVRTIAAWIEAQAANLKANARSIGQAIIDGIAGAIRGGFSTISGAINSIISGALQGAQDDNEVRSPSRKWARELGAPLGQGLLQGLQEASRPFDATVSGLVAPTVRPSTSPALAVDGGQRGGGVTVVFNGPVYGLADFEQQVMDVVGSGLRRGLTLGVR